MLLSVILEIDRSTQTNLISKKNVNAGSNTKTSEYKVKQIAFDVFPSPLMIAVIPQGSARDKRLQDPFGGTLVCFCFGFSMKEVISPAGLRFISSDSFVQCVKVLELFGTPYQTK